MESSLEATWEGWRWVFGDNYHSVASERLHAAEWLCGLGSERYSEVEV